MKKLIAFVVLLSFVLSWSSCKTSSDYIVENLQTEDDACLIVMAYPEEVCRTTEAFYSKLLPLVGMGRQGRIRAGHAIMLVAKEGSHEVEYFDFGRYITPDGYSRARGANTDPEARVPVKAQWKGKHLSNVEEIIKWVHSQKHLTHGVGSLYTSISEEVNYANVKEYVAMIQAQGIMPYGPFEKKASNCARFVTGGIYNGLVNENTKKKVGKTYRMTPSGLSNVATANSYDWYYVIGEDNELRKDSLNLKRLQRDIIVDWGKGYGPKDPVGYGSVLAPKDVKVNEHWQWLGGFGSGAWFDIEETAEENKYLVSRVNVDGELDYKTYFYSEKAVDISGGYVVTYPNHFSECAIIVDGETFLLKHVEGSRQYEMDDEMMAGH